MVQPKRKRPKPVPVFLRRLRKHFGSDPAALPVLEHQFATHDRPNLQLALEEMVAKPKWQSELVGVLAQSDYEGPSLAGLSQPRSARQFANGPVQYLDIALPGGRHLSCVKLGLYFLHDGKKPIALLVSAPRFSHPPTIQVEVMAGERDHAETFIRELKKLTQFGKAYRGHVLSIEEDCHGGTVINHHDLPAIRREDLILPESLLQRIERHTLSFTKHAQRLREAGRHLKRGILLFGPPGTGKTLSAMYLATQMTGRTVLLITGGGAGSIETACRLARLLEPATVILEDVDLIGTERQHQQIGANALLFELLNQMDGLSNDVDVLFVLTTNRPDVLEPALASRPGRVDQAIEVPPPDSECRQRLFELYSRGMKVEVTDWPKLIERTTGASGAFIRELLRKAAVFAAEENGDATLVVRDQHIEEGLAELLIVGGQLTKSLLGATTQTIGQR